MNRRAFAILVGCTLALVACDDDDGLLIPQQRHVTIDSLLDGDFAVTRNASGLTPLVAEVTFQSRVPVNVTTEVLGSEPLRHEMPGVGTVHKIPILGLYPDRENRVEIRLSDTELTFAVDTVVIPTDTLPSFFPTVEVTAADRSRMEGGWTLSSLAIGTGGGFHSWPMMFDSNGDIRWYMDLSFLDGFVFVVKRAANGNLIFAHDFVVYEYDMLGRQFRRWDIPGFDAHHELVEKPDGSFLVAVDVVGRGTVGDHIIEVDRVSGAIVNEWDFREILDVYRRTFVDRGGDWFHMNAIFYSEADDALIVSGRNQSAIVKVTNNNELIWILGPHSGWGLAGVDADGHDTSEFLLTAVDADGVPYPDSVQQGYEDAPDFRWPWGQHAAMILPNGNLFLFDNGFTRNFDEDAAPFSRGVEYEIDESAMTVRQVWQYGEERGPDYYSPIISDVDFLPSTGNRLIMPGIVNQPGPSAFVTEVSYPGKEVIFEAIIKKLGGPGVFSVYRSERLPIYFR